MTELLHLYQEWKRQFPLLSNITVLFEDEGAFHDTNYSEYCHCPRNQSSCEEYSTNYSFTVIFQKDNGDEIFNLFAEFEQDKDDGGDKVYFDEPKYKYHTQEVDLTFFQNQNVANDIVSSLLRFIVDENPQSDLAQVEYLFPFK